MTLFNEIYQLYSPALGDLQKGWRRLFLCAATEHNHIDLVKLLLSDELYNPDIKLPYRITNPLFFAIYSNNLKLVELFLYAGSSMSLKSENPLRLSKPVIGHVSDCIPDNEDMISAVEFACTLNKTKMLQFMVTYDNYKKAERYVAIFLTHILHCNNGNN